MLFDRIPTSVFPGFHPVAETPKAVLPFHSIKPLSEQPSPDQSLSEDALLRQEADTVVDVASRHLPFQRNESRSRGQLFKEAQQWGGHIAAKALSPVIPVPSLTPSGQKFH